jgi:hypothetical protein
LRWQNLPEIQKRHEELLAKRRTKSKYSKDTNDYDMKTVIEFAAAESARVALRQLICTLEGWVGSQRIKLIIYFDEAHSLTKAVPENDEKTLHDFLCSCLNQLLAFPVFYIFLSTNASLTKYAPPRPLAPSARIRRGTAKTHAPITEHPLTAATTSRSSQAS